MTRLDIKSKIVNQKMKQFRQKPWTFSLDRVGDLTSCISRGGPQSQGGGASKHFTELNSLYRGESKNSKFLYVGEKNCKKNWGEKIILGKNNWGEKENLGKNKFR